MLPAELAKVRSMLPPEIAKLPVWVWVVVVVAVLYGVYYLGTHKQSTTQPVQQPTATQPGQPGVPGGQGQGGGISALAQEQSFQANIAGVNGYVEVENGQWANNSNVIVQSVTLECVQYSASGQQLTQTQTTLNGPLSPSMTSYIPSFQAGQIVQGATSAKCGIVAATQATP